ncbi:hypothetical protein COT52_01315 [candidate division WWE3 bacterium CG08_land_8_20_14_0_20_43_13]|uniref:Uncharacterized protein n=1 Tax=candidate division WWE3 bacterium CG08_land_8_20_14_0_20_43_13 TaxID=1975087 RepID=A0A2H0X7M3_UNCKA|nr:MAG: hypothetical protein COT52_01315 [candidate division WWE3 bacterium CG08_land_8_20_14_0_20_43_13]
MLNLNEITKYYPEELHSFKKSLLREYLQYKILEIVYTGKYANKLIFLGGTALRIIHNNQRFSEDIDFDNKDLEEKEFNELAETIKNNLEQQGFEVEIRTVYKNAFRCYIKIPKLLFNQGLSPLESEKITIQIDTVPQNFNFEPEIYNLDKFDVYTQIKITPLELILSQKLYAIFNRNSLKGRDFFDVDFLINNKEAKPNFEYLKAKLNICNSMELKANLKAVLEKTDFEKLAKDVENFLFDQKQRARVTEFYKKIENWKF